MSSRVPATQQSKLNSFPRKSFILYNILFIYLCMYQLMDIWVVSYSRLLAIMNICFHFSCEWNCWVIWVIPCLMASGTARLFSKVTTVSHSHQLYMKVPISPHTCQNLSFYFSHPTACQVVPHCSFDLHFPDDGF